MNYIIFILGMLIIFSNISKMGLLNNDLKLTEKQERIRTLITNQFEEYKLIISRLFNCIL